MIINRLTPVLRLRYRNPNLLRGPEVAQEAIHLSFGARWGPQDLVPGTGLHCSVQPLRISLPKRILSPSGDFNLMLKVAKFFSKPCELAAIIVCGGDVHHRDLRRCTEVPRHIFTTCAPHRSRASRFSLSKPC